MIRVVPNGWFSSHDFTVFDRGETPVGWVDLSKRLWSESAKLEVVGTRYEAHSKERAAREFVLQKEDGKVVAVAQKPSVWKSGFVFEHAGNRYELKKESTWGSTFVLSRDGAGPVGSVRIKGSLKLECTVDVPEELPLEVGVFIAYLMIILWKRAMAAAGAGGAAGG